jgi:hypothetical protein
MGRIVNILKKTVMDNNSLVADYSQWERGKDFPDFMDEVALSTISKGYLLPGETPKKHTEELLMQ